MIYLTPEGMGLFHADEIDLLKRSFDERREAPEPSLAAALSPPKWTPPTGAPAQEVRL